MFRLSVYKMIIIGLVIGAGFLWYYLRVSTTFPFRYYDEAWWIGDSYFYDLLLHDRKNPLWDSVYSYDQPQLVHYVFGMILSPHYFKEKKSSPQLSYMHYISSHKLLCRECIDVRSLPSGVSTISEEQFSRNISTDGYSDAREIILRIRKFNASVAALTVVVMYVLGVMMWGVGGGIAFALLYGSNSLIMRTTLIAHADALFLFFYSCALVLLYLFLRKGTVRYIFSFALFTGLAASTKIVGFILLPILGMFQIIRCVQSRVLPSTVKIVVVECTIAFIISCSVFILLNPFIQKDTMNRMRIMYQHRLVQQHAFQLWYPENRLPNMVTRIISIGKLYFSIDPAPFSAPMVFGGYTGYLNSMYGIIVVLGLLTYSKRIHTIKNIKRSDLFVLVAGYFIVLSMLAWLTVGWERYYTVVTWVIVALQIEGISLCIRVVSSFVPYTSQPKSPPLFGGREF